LIMEYNMRQTTQKTRYAICDIGYTERRTGFTLVELLLALAITAILLTAVALAFNASVINYRENEDIFKAINSARQTLFRITSQLRTATAVDPAAPANECSMITAAGEDITYRYDNTARVLYLITNDDLTDDDYVLCSNVNSVTFTKDSFVEVIAGVPTVKVKSVQIVISVASDGVEKKLAAAAVVRRNLH
jgi:prepilin-type N-terminal cleavage/methylation domain-containing protein